MESPVRTRHRRGAWPYGALAALMVVVPLVVGAAVTTIVLLLPPASGQLRMIRTVLLTGAAVTVWIGFIWWFIRKLFVAADHLQVAVQRVTSGDLGPMERQPMPTPFLDDLQGSFGRMVDRLQEVRQALDAQMQEERAVREELQSLQRQVIRQERLAAVGLLVSGVAHEVNNPLQAILGFAELLQMQNDLPEQVQKDLTIIKQESVRACNIIRNLAMFARQQPGQAQPTRLSDVIASVVELRQRRLLTEQIVLTVEDQSVAVVMAVFTELQQVLLNMVVNAEQAIRMAKHLPGRIIIRTRDEAGSVVVEVEDTGAGVAPEDEAKLFQPFFTTKPVGEGTGLGLSVSYGIIESMGGRLSYRRSAGGGAIFHFELPAHVS